MKYQIKHLGEIFEIETTIFKDKEYYKGVKIFEKDGVWKSKNGRKILPYSGTSKRRLLSSLFSAEKNGNMDLG